ncbi:MAG: COX15/CtaA family protein [bacterium]
MGSLRRFSYVAFFTACLHLVFGAIVRISGSGMGCGNHWPKCYGYWFPPLSRPDLIVEVTHRYLASLLLLSLVALFVAAWHRRDEPGVSGPRGVLRSSALAVALGVSAALLGAVTVKFGNAPFATLAHWTVAMSLVATVVATVIRAGGLGGTTALAGGVSQKTKRAAFAAAGLALAAVVMGGLTAKYPGAAVACPSFPLCGTNPDVQGAAVGVQLTHRVIAVLLILHLIGVVMALRKRKEAPLIRRVAGIALSLGVLQLLVAGAMIGMHMPPAFRSLHEATGVSIWIATFALAYLARIASDGHGVRELRVAPSPVPLADAGLVRVGATARGASSTAVAESPRRGAIEPKEPWQERATALRLEASQPVLPSEVSELLVSVPDEQARPALAVLPRDDNHRDTMRHSVAVIVARGADL